MSAQRVWQLQGVMQLPSSAGIIGNSSFSDIISSSVFQAATKGPFLCPALFHMWQPWHRRHLLLYAETHLSPLERLQRWWDLPDEDGETEQERALAMGGAARAAGKALELQICLQGTGTPPAGDSSGRTRRQGSDVPTPALPLCGTDPVTAGLGPRPLRDGQLCQQCPGQAAPSWQCLHPSQFQPVPSRSHGNL